MRETEIIPKGLTCEDLASKFNVTPQYIRSLFRKGVIPGIQYGKVWVGDASILEDTRTLYSIMPDVQDQVNTAPFKSKPIALSFFSGAMGLDYGIEESGFDIRLTSEIDSNARKTILLNRPQIGLVGDISNFTAMQIRKYAGLSAKQEIDLVFGGPPCQAFSTAGKREGFNDKRGNVFLTYIDLALELKPKFILIENVRGILSAPLNHRPHSDRGFGYPPLTLDEDKGGALSYILKRISDGGYHYSFNLYNSANFGTPQKRERVIIICSRLHDDIPFLEPTHSDDLRFKLKPWTTFREACSGLPKKHDSLKFPEKRLKYYRLLKAGQYWKHLPEELQKEALGASFFAGGGKTGFLRRLAWDLPSPTLVTNPTMPATDLAHPEEDRPLSIQEYMRLQQFPDNWKLFGDLTNMYKQIGNAVPTGLAKAAGKHIIKLLQGKNIKAMNSFKHSRYVNTCHKTFSMNQVALTLELD